jgi:long-chain acyl-CoA synthetase
MNVAHLLFEAARSFPERPAVSIGDRRLYDYLAYGNVAARLAGGMRERLKLQYGDRVALAMSNNPEYLAILFAIWRAGLVAVPANAKLHAREIAYIIADSGARLCLATPEIAGPLAPLLPEGVCLIVLGNEDWRKLAASESAPMAPTLPDHPAWIFYTSGTTGRPKGALLTHRNLITMAIGYLADVDRLTPDDCFIHVAAQSHATGLFGLSHIAKATHQVMPPSGGFDAGELADLLRLYNSATLFVPPTGLRRLLHDPAFAKAPIERMRTLLLGAAPIHAVDLKAGFEIFGPRLWNGYGQGESPCTITALSKEMLAEAILTGNEAHLMSVGIARSGIEVAVVDGDDRFLPTGEVGEVVVRGDTVMAGYLNLPDESAAALRGGWLHTGDVGSFDERGFLTLYDRIKDVIISGGLNIYPREIEEILLESGQLAEVAVIGIPDPEWGESVMAIVVPAPGVTPDFAALDQICLDRIARFKRPKYWRVAASLPKNPAGKVLKRELRQQYQEEITKSH